MVLRAHPVKLSAVLMANFPRQPVHLLESFLLTGSSNDENAMLAQPIIQHCMLSNSVFASEALNHSVEITMSRFNKWGEASVASERNTVIMAVLLELGGLIVDKRVKLDLVNSGHGVCCVSKYLQIAHSVI